MTHRKTKSGALTTLQGQIDKITYYNDDTHYTIAKLETEKNRNLVTIIGYLSQPTAGEILKVTGTWETHPRYGQQLRVVSYELVMPATVSGITNYLKAGFIKGIGPKTAAVLVSHFKEKTLEIIEKNPQKLTEVKGVGQEKAARIHQAWKAHHDASALMQFLQENGLKAAWGAKIIKTYGVAKALEVLHNDPYRLANDIPKIGFYIADTIARNSGIAPDESGRAAACVLHLLQESAEAGNVFMAENQLIRRCERLFEISSQNTRQAIKNLEKSKDIKIDVFGDDRHNRFIYLASLHRAEAGLCERLKALISHPVRELALDAEQITSQVLKKLAVRLSSQQIRILQGILSQRVAIITGGPGTGKTTLIRAISALAQAIGKQVLLAAPTGRAARRLSEITSKKAATIHRLLRYNPGEATFEKNQDNPLEGDMVIIDEASMVDTVLMFHLLNAIWIGAGLILVGDVSQLPSVGPGNVLADLIRSQKIKTYELKEIFRQAHESPIVLNAHRVRRGEFPEIEHDGFSQDFSEFTFIGQSHPETIVNTIVELCRHKIPQQLGLDPVDEIQVLSPMHKGLLGTYNLNHVLQENLNANPVVIKAAGNAFKLGDKVMHLKNNYHKEVFNGDIGRICDIDRNKQELHINYDNRIVCYDFNEIDEINLAYAISVHKSQGSEYPAVIVPLTTQHYALLQRNLLYTAITRGEKLVILIGTPKALSIALNNAKPDQRFSSLADRLAIW